MTEQAKRFTPGGKLKGFSQLPRMTLRDIMKKKREDRNKSRNLRDDSWLDTEHHAFNLLRIPYGARARYPISAWIDRVYVHCLSRCIVVYRENTAALENAIRPAETMAVRLGHYLCS